jgi:hypothetical protein
MLKAIYPKNYVWFYSDVERWNLLSFSKRSFWIAYFLDVVRRLILKENKSKKAEFWGNAFLTLPT